MPYPEKFTGFQIHGPDTWLEFHKNEFDPKPFGDYDVDIQIECCGVCGSDVHTISGGWGEQHFPLTVGHGELKLEMAITLVLEVSAAASVAALLLALGVVPR